MPAKLTPDILYKDDYLYVVNKPNDLLVHHSYYARNIQEKSLVQLLREEGPVFPVHRLDRKTSGIMLFARDSETARQLQAQFEGHQVVKTYVALVRGFTPDKGVIDTPVKNPDTGVYHEACTRYETINRIEVDVPVEPYRTARYSLIRLFPETGRTHQLRKHMNKIAHPIIGDTKYGNRHHNRMFAKKFGHTLLYLHAYSIELEYPQNQKVVFRANFPVFWEKDLTQLGFLGDNLMT